jgi:hypothetical protein
MTETDIQSILTEIENINVNQCVITTYDQGVAECVRLQILNQLATAHGVRYVAQVKTPKGFPYAGSKL